MKSLFLVFSIIALALAVNGQDLGVLNYALTLEHLEAAFYVQGIAQFTQQDFVNAGYPSYAYAEFGKIAEHETTHVQTLTAVINSISPGSAVPACQYNFPISNVTQFVTIARSLELTGVSAYLGRVADIVNKDILTAAGTIVTVEARHAGFLNILNKYSPAPASFDIPLNVRSVISLAAPLIVSCPYDLGTAPYPALTVSVVASERIEVLVNGTAPQDGLFCYFFGVGQAFTTISNSQCDVPSNISGEVYVFITNSTTALTLAPGGDSSVTAGPAVLTLRSALDMTPAQPEQTCSLSSGVAMAASANSATVMGFLVMSDVNNNRYGSMMNSDGRVMSYFSTSQGTTSASVVFTSSGATFVCPLTLSTSSLALSASTCSATQGAGSCTPTVIITNPSSNMVQISQTCGASSGSVTIDAFTLNVLG